MKEGTKMKNAFRKNFPLVLAVLMLVAHLTLFTSAVDEVTINENGTTEHSIVYETDLNKPKK